jgi:hypothetical protein
MTATRALLVVSIFLVGTVLAADGYIYGSVDEGSYNAAYYVIQIAWGGVEYDRQVEHISEGYSSDSLAVGKYDVRCTLFDSADSMLTADHDTVRVYSGQGTQCNFDFSILVDPLSETSWGALKALVE